MIPERELLLDEAIQDLQKMSNQDVAGVIDKLKRVKQLLTASTVPEWSLAERHAALKDEVTLSYLEFLREDELQTELHEAEVHHYLMLQDRDIYSYEEIAESDRHIRLIQQELKRRTTIINE